MSEESDIRLEKVRELIREKGADAWPGGSDNTANVLGERRELSGPMSDDDAHREMSRRSRRAFLTGGLAAAAAIVGWRWIPDEAKAAIYRRAFEFNENLSQILYSPRRLAPEYPREQVSKPRVNGLEGLQSEIDLDAWRLSVVGLPGGGRTLTLSDIKTLPRTEMTTELKCIEGWSIIVHWAGVRFSEFAASLSAISDLPKYVSLVTPDDGYFVGWDLASIMHPQTLLAYEMNGAPLTPEHGAPLRLASPTKYGIKQIKRIGRIEFTDARPRDFWAEYGYDWYSGH